MTRGAIGLCVASRTTQNPGLSPVKALTLYF